ncbi:hypothetical protein [Helicobacter cetorum]|uniref:hypothetical protein n=1 Tax=Helicobacter cetorum TaxID=138563 RepID=UPI000CF05886|nr:hypothetical protein [Helicobacter cetorum]
MWSWSHIAVSSMVAILGLAVVGILMLMKQDFVESNDKSSKGFLGGLLGGGSVWAWLTGGSAAGATSGLATLGLGSMFPGLGVAMGVGLLASWLISRKRSLTPSEKFKIFILSIISFLSILAMIGLGGYIIWFFDSLSFWGTIGWCGAYLAVCIAPIITNAIIYSMLDDL